MKKVLIVDDDSITRSLLSRVLSPHRDFFEVITSENGRDAANIIKNEKIDLVITDLKMPIIDGFQLLAHMNKNFPEIPVFVMTGHGSPDVDLKINAIGPSRYFKKPLNMDTLTDCIFEELNAGAEGELRGINLASFLQLIEMEKKTCTLEIISDNKIGKIYFRKGDAFGAETEDKINEEAIFEILCWDRAEIRIQDTNKKTKKEITQPLINILMEGLKIKDEQDSMKKGIRNPLKPLKKLKLKSKRK